MSTIYLVRHGQKESGPGDPGLTELGLRQAQETGLYLKQFPITQVIASPTQRTRQTAEQIATALHLEPTTHQSLIERMDWTDEQVTFADFIQEWSKATHDREYVPKFGDSSRLTGERIQQLITSLGAAEEHVLLVSHGGAIIDYLRNIFDDSNLEHLLKEYSLGPDYQMMHCAINMVVLGEEPVLKLLNFIDHLSQPTE